MGHNGNSISCMILILKGPNVCVCAHGCCCGIQFLLDVGTENVHHFQKINHNISWMVVFYTLRVLPFQEATCPFDHFKTMLANYIKIPIKTLSLLFKIILKAITFRFIRWFTSIVPHNFFFVTKFNENMTSYFFSWKYRFSAQLWKILHPWVSMNWV